MSTALQSYLAKNYLNATNTDGSDLSTRPKKRRKRDGKKSTTPEGLVIADDDEDLSLSNTSNNNAHRRRAPAGRDEGDDGDDTPQIYEGRVRSTEFRKKKDNGSSSWRSVPDAIPSTTDGTNTGNQDPDETAEADRIIAAASAANDTRRQGIDEDDAPAVVDDNAPKMESGVRAGLQTAADTARLVAAEEAEREREERAARKERKLLRKSRDDPPPVEQQTIYRDATGRRIDVSAKRAEAAAAEREKEKERQREREQAMGDVQRKMREERKQNLEEAKFLTVARGVDDQEMNDELKEVERWDDPMAAYLARQRAEEGVVEDAGGDVGKVKLGKGGKQKKVYQGAAPPNRYGIVPGWRWDGVDRGNGFEKEWFQARSKKSRNEDMKYQWQMDE